MKVIEEDDKIKILVSNYLFDIEKEDNLKKILKIIKNKYQIKNRQIYFIKVFKDENYGYLITVYFTDDDLFFLDDDINVQVIDTKFKFIIDDDYQLNYLKKIQPFITLNKKISNLEIGNILEHTIDIIIDEDV